MLDLSIQRTYDLLSTSAVQFEIRDWSLIELTGADRLEWLQGQATNDLRGLSEGETRRFCLCKPTGQVVAICTVTSSGLRLFLSCPTPCAEAVMQRIEDMVILEDVQGNDLTSSLKCVSIQGVGASAISMPPDSVSVANDRCGWGGIDLWLAGSEVEGLDRGHEQALEIARVEAGIPKWGVDIGSKTLPPELGPNFERQHVSYSKGCYTGQEVLMRIQSSGHTNWTWRGLRCEQAVERGAPVKSLDHAELGRVTSAVVSPLLGPVSTAMLRNQAKRDEPVLVQAQTGPVPAIVAELPLRP